MAQPLGEIEKISMRYITTIDGREYQVEILDEHHVSVDGAVYTVDFLSISDQPVYSLIVNGQSFDTQVYPEDDQWQVIFRGTLYSVSVEDEREKRLRETMGGGVPEYEEYHLRAPMPGMIVAVPVTEGQTVAKGEVLLVLESMKMQNELRSPRAGKVTRLRVKIGDRVEQKETMLSVS
jgi:biotin carboxyl carrier protein